MVLVNPIIYYTCVRTITCEAKVYLKLGCYAHKKSDQEEQGFLNVGLSNHTSTNHRDSNYTLLEACL
jgi:hypothetical protein